MGKTEEEVRASIGSMVSQLTTQVEGLIAVQEAIDSKLALANTINVIIERRNFKGRFVHMCKGKPRRRHPIKLRARIPAWLAYTA